jgi:hypothetical protein
MQPSTQRNLTDTSTHFRKISFDEVLDVSGSDVELLRIALRISGCIIHIHMSSIVPSRSTKPNPNEFRYFIVRRGLRRSQPLFEPVS